MVQGINTLIAQVTTLAQAVTTLTGTSRPIASHTHPINIIEKPKAFEEKILKAARLFCSSFVV